MRISLQNIAPFWNNPVVVRDMRVRMRGTRAYINQAIYLAVLSIIAVTGYASSTSFGGVDLSDPIEIQNRLQQFYYWIFEGLAILITLIAPALTAVAIISEKKMQTLDLLVTTPMSSMQMLLGKLISSIAFILLLLMLSIPASSLCIILGGSTIGDVLQSYALLTISGILMAAIGLAASCTAKQHIQAIVTTYGAIILLLILTMVFGSTAMAMVFARMSGGSHTGGPAMAAFLELNPFFAAAFPSFNVSIVGVNIPVWLVTGVMCFVFVRLILTGAALELGSYGTELTASHRRQTLLATILFAFIIGQSLTSISGADPKTLVTLFLGVVSFLFAVSLFFLPSLFVPALDEDAAPGTKVVGSYIFKNVFRAAHSGSLPFFQLWIITLTAGILVGLVFPSGAKSVTFAISGMHTTVSDIPVFPLIGTAGYVLVYLSGLGFTLWSIARRAATWSANAGQARAVSFLLFVFIILAPVMIMSTQSGLSNGGNSDAFTSGIVRFFWLLYPFTDYDQGIKALPWLPFVLYGLAGYVLGAVIYSPFADVTPGTGSRTPRRTARSVGTS